MLIKKTVTLLAATSILLAGSLAWADDDAIMDVDNHSVSFVGTWGDSTTKILYYGDNYSYAWGCGDSCSTATATATFTTKQTADISGYYNVHVRHTTHANREETAYFRIYSVVSGTPTYRGYCYVNQTQNGGEWLYCNNVYLPAGSYGQVVLGNEYTNENEVVIADGVRFIRTGVDGADILDSSITSADIATGGVASVDILDSTITGADIASNTITSVDIANSSIYDYDIVDEPGVEDVGGNQSVALTSTDTTIRTVSVTAPSSGYIIVNVTGYFYDTADSTSRCSITTGTALDYSYLSLGALSSSIRYMPVALTRTYYVSSSGTTTYRLVCDAYSGTPNIEDTNMNAIYVPTGY